MLDIQNLHVAVGGAEILKGLTLRLRAGETHAIMGPNGAGKSTLGYTLAGRPGYEATSGSASFEGEDLLALTPEDRAAKGVFLSFQYPVEIPGVPMMTFVKAALNAQRKARGEAEASAGEVLRLVRAKAEALKVDPDILKRAVNVGFSGGEKKRLEMLQMTALEPKLCILDETDSGLDIDALRIVADAVNAMRAPERSMLIVTHYQRLLDLIRPDFVHVMVAGRIVESGGPDLALALEREGYDKYLAAA